MNRRTVKKRAILRKRRHLNRRVWREPIGMRRPNAKVRGWDGRNWHNPARVSSTQVIDAYGEHFRNLAESYARLLTNSLVALGALPADMYFVIEPEKEPNLTGIRGPSADLIIMDEVTCGLPAEEAEGNPTPPDSSSVSDS